MAPAVEAECALRSWHGVRYPPDSKRPGCTRAAGSPQRPCWTALRPCPLVRGFAGSSSPPPERGLPGGLVWERLAGRWAVSRPISDHCSTQRSTYVGDRLSARRSRSAHRLDMTAVTAEVQT